MDNLFTEACKNGDIIEAKKLYSPGANDYNYYAFRLSCYYGQKEIAEWLYSLGANIHAQIHNAFQLSCYNGHKEIAQWLYILGANIHADDDFAFRWSCENGHKEIAEWLYSLGANIHANDDRAFLVSCKNGHKEIAEWLYSLGANIHAKNDYAFRWSCKHDKKEIIQSLLNIGKFDDNLINKYSECYNEQIIKQIFDKGYKPLNDQMKEFYKRYSERKREIKLNTRKYIVPELVDLVYDYE